MLKIVTLGDEKLYRGSEEIVEINDEIVKLVKDMYETMYFTNNGIGLAAVQVGVLKRLFIIDIPKYGKYTMINPQILDRSTDSQIFEEGCLSIPGIGGEVERAKSIVIEYTDIKGNRNKLETSDFPATCIQHEYDHLEGTLFIDRLPPEDKLTKIKEYRSLHIL